MEKQLSLPNAIIFKFAKANFHKCLSQSRHHGHDCAQSNDWWVEVDDSVWAVCSLDSGKSFDLERPVFALPVHFAFRSSLILDTIEKRVLKSAKNIRYYQYTFLVPEEVKQLTPYGSIGDNSEENKIDSQEKPITGSE